jgi:hypothetical protein
VTDEARKSGQGRRGRRPAGEPPAIGSNPADGSETWAATGPIFLLCGLSRDKFFPSFCPPIIGVSENACLLYCCNFCLKHASKATSVQLKKKLAACSNTTRQEPTDAICLYHHHHLFS